MFFKEKRDKINFEITENEIQFQLIYINLHQIYTFNVKLKNLYSYKDLVDSRAHYSSNQFIKSVT